MVEEKEKEVMEEKEKKVLEEKEEKVVEEKEDSLVFTFFHYLTYFFLSNILMTEREDEERVNGGGGEWNWNAWFIIFLK